MADAGQEKQYFPATAATHLGEKPAFRTFAQLDSEMFTTSGHSSVAEQKLPKLHTDTAVRSQLTENLEEPAAGRS